MQFLIYSDLIDLFYKKPSHKNLKKVTQSQHNLLKQLILGHFVAKILNGLIHA
jgi:hypothetical protein